MRKSHHVHARVGGSHGQKSQLDRAVDDLERLEAGATIGVVDRNLVIGETAGGRAVEQAAGGDGDLERAA